jgi:hypothetical protein
VVLWMAQALCALDRMTPNATGAGAETDVAVGTGTSLGSKDGSTIISGMY